MSEFGVAIYGAGWVSVEHMKAYEKNPHCKVVAVGSRRESSVRQRAAEAGVTEARIYTDLEALLADEAVDIVSITSPSHLHPEQAILAAEAGKHLCIEKPVALNLHDLRRMAEVVKAAEVKTVVSFVLRWNPLVETIKALLTHGAIGDIFYAEVDYWHGVSDWYSGWEWWTGRETSGSSFLAAGCHAVDALRWFMPSEVVEVSAYSTKVDKRYEYDPTIIAALKFANGAVGKLSSSLECQMPYNFNIDLLGTQGAIRDNRLYSKTLLPGQTDFTTIPTINPDSGDVAHHPFEGQINHFIDCILNNVESHCNLAEAVLTHELCMACDISAEQGTPVKLPL